MPQDHQKSTKSRSDTAVQGTNDSSIVSKCSMVNQGYFQDEFVNHFVAKQLRRSSLINRGYYVRSKALEHVFKSFFSWCKSKENQVISLGAGFDSAFFRLKSESLLENTRFIEVDFPDVVHRKVALIKSHHQLKDLLEDELRIPDKIRNLKDVCPLYCSPGYYVIGCDLKQVAKLTSCLEHCGIDCQKPTLVLSECVITYMSSKSSNPVIQWISQAFPDAMFVSYEQIYPYDAFGQVMCSHFKKIGSPLKSIETFPTPAYHMQRYCTLGWDSCISINMNELCCSILPQEEIHRINDLELFDEYEEFHSKCSHYMLCCASNGFCQELQSNISKGISNEENNSDENEEAHHIRCSVYPCTPEGAIQRYGHKSSLLGPSKIVHTGGFGVMSGGHTKVSKIEVLDLVLKSITDVQCLDMDPLDCRMHHTLTRLTDSQLLIFGGRRSPAKPLNDSCLLNFSTNEKSLCYTQEKLKCSVEPSARWRHSATVFTKNECQNVAVYGGKSTCQVLGDLWLLNVESKEWAEVLPFHPRPSPRHSHSCCAWGNKLIVTGGLDDHGHPISDTIILDTTDWSWRSLRTTPKIKPRYSHTSHVVKDLMLLIGGLSLSPVTFGVTTVNLFTGIVTEHSLLVENPEKPTMLFKITSEVLNDEKKILIFGGGGNCFSFGTHFNSSPLSLDIAKCFL